MAPNVNSRPSSRGESSKEEKKSRRPDNSAFKQQRLKAWQPILTASTVLPVFFFIGVVFVPIGIGLLVSSNKIQEKIIEYTECGSCENHFKDVKNTGTTCNCVRNFTLSSDFNGQVYLYYGLSNFYQNHRRYVRSRDDTQLHGELKSTLDSNCKPFREKTVKVGNISESLPVAPCGAIANSLFNDTFQLFYVQSGVRESVALTHRNIAWKSDRETKFQNPKVSGTNKTLKDAFKGFTNPPNWGKKNVWQLDPFDDSNNGFINQDFIVWMRVAAFPTFRKLYRKVKHDKQPFRDRLPKGKYELDIAYRYPVSSFDGKKRVILTTTSWIGGKNPFLGTAYIAVGTVCLIFGFIFLVIHLKVRTRHPRNLTRE